MVVCDFCEKMTVTFANDFLGKSGGQIRIQRIKIMRKTHLKCIYTQTESRYDF